MPEDVAPFFVAVGEADNRIRISSLDPFQDDVYMAVGVATIHRALPS